MSIYVHIHLYICAVCRGRRERGTLGRVNRLHSASCALAIVAVEELIVQRFSTQRARDFFTLEKQCFGLCLALYSVFFDGSAVLRRERAFLSFISFIRP